MLFTKHDIRPRGLSETVTLVRRYSVTDDHGMQAFTSGEAVCEVPAQVTMLSGYAKMQFYESLEIEAYDVVIRYVCNKFEEILWNGSRLIVDSVEDEGMRHRWLRIRCSRRDER